MNTVTPGSKTNIFKKKKTIRFIAFCLVAALLAGGAYIFVQAKNSKSGGSTTQRTAKVIRGTLTDSIAGSAPIQSSYRSELSPKVTATLEQINIKEGDQVKKGDVLFVLDNTDALLEIENAENSINQMQLTLDSTNKSVSGLVVQAPYNGQVTNISVKTGDMINKGGAILTITDTSKLCVTLPFSGPSAKNVTLGQGATVYLQELMLSVEGTVTYKSNSSYTTAMGGELYNIEISVNNPGSLKDGMKATAEITAGDTVLDSVESGELSFVNQKMIKSDAGGTVVSLHIRENEYVNAGDVLLKLENDDLLLTSSSNDMKMDNLKAQLAIKQKQLDYYTIVAPFDGTITKLGSANEGDTVKQGDTLAVISDMNRLEFSVSIDELDIAQMAVGQEVIITADALEETATTPLTGKVSKVAMEGTSSNGVTVYPVTIAIDENSAGRLKTGMNIDAEIIISNKSDTLMVPLEAVTTMGGRSFVYVKGIVGDSGQSGKAKGQSGTTGTIGSKSGNAEGQSGSRTRQSGSFGSGSSNRPSRPGNTSGGAIGGGAGRTTGSGITGNMPQGAPVQGDMLQGTPPQRDFSQSDFPQGMSEQNGNSQDQQAGNASGSAVQSGFKRTAMRAGSDSYYEGAAMVEVETGISNDTYIEIVSGLTEGQEIVLPKTSTSASSTSVTSGRSRGGSMGGGMMGGAIPGGAMPGGGGPGGF